MHLSRKGRLLGGGLTAIALIVAGLAYAAWTTNGTGSGTAKAQSAQNLTTSDVSATTSANLYPGATGNVKIEINNPNPYPVKVTEISGNGAITPDSAHAAGCTTTGVTFSDQSDGLSISVPANGSVTSTLNNAVSMSNQSSNGCQGAVFTVPVAITGASDAS